MLLTVFLSISTHGRSRLKEDLPGLEKLTGDKGDGILSPGGRLAASLRPLVAIETTAVRSSAWLDNEGHHLESRCGHELPFFFGGV